LNLKNVLKGLIVKDLEAAVDFNCKIWVKGSQYKEVVHKKSSTFFSMLLLKI